MEEPATSGDAATDDEKGPYVFNLGTLENRYFRIAGDKLGIDHDVYLAESLPIDTGTFVAPAISLSSGKFRASPQPLFDFELIKRKYANIVDILSYDDLLRPAVQHHREIQ